MHSSRMRTGRSLTICLTLLLGGGVGGVGDGVSPKKAEIKRKSPPQKSGSPLTPPQPPLPTPLSPLPPSTPPHTPSTPLPTPLTPPYPPPYPPPLDQTPPGLTCKACWDAHPPCGQTHACENITLAQLRCGR